MQNQLYLFFLSLFLLSLSPLSFSFLLSFLSPQFFFSPGLLLFLISSFLFLISSFSSFLLSFPSSVSYSSFLSLSPFSLSTFLSYSSLSLMYLKTSSLQRNSKPENPPKKLQTHLIPEHENQVYKHQCIPFASQERVSAS